MAIIPVARLQLRHSVHVIASGAFCVPGGQWSPYQHLTTLHKHASMFKITPVTWVSLATPRHRASWQLEEIHIQHSHGERHPALWTVSSPGILSTAKGELSSLWKELTGGAHSPISELLAFKIQ